MAFDTYNAILFKIMADNRNIKDSNSILLAAGLSTGSPVNKMVLPFQLVEKTEELEKKDQEVRTVRKAHSQLIEANETLADERDFYRLENDRINRENERLKNENKAHLDLLKNIVAVANSAEDEGAKIEKIKKALNAAPVPIVPPNVPVNG